ncbi:MAG TPA: YdeI/OmpD-associated family protein [Dehalococcoidales bacterium]
MEEQVLFSDREEFRQWLFENHGANKGIWLVFGKGSRLKTIKPDEALEEALCFGWIDGQIKSIDAEKYLKKFTPRTIDSKWSETNRTLAARLIVNGKMTEYGAAAIKQAKSKGIWDIPKGAPVSDNQIEILINALKGADLALANFMRMPLSVKRTYTALYLDAKKEETKIRRLEKIIERLNENKKPM